MGLTDIVSSSLSSFLHSNDSSSHFSEVWALSFGAETATAFSWTIFSASVFVLVALVLSMYLIFEHLAAYNQPEVLSYSLCSLKDLLLRFSVDDYY